MNRYWTETYGCQMNKAESNHLERELQENGWSRAEQPDTADIVILNTCSVRTTAENRIWGRIGYFKHLKDRHPHTLVIMGCMAERLKDRIRETAPSVDVVVGNFQKKSFIDDLCRGKARVPSAVSENPKAYSFAPDHGKDDEFKSYVPIMHGCDNFCSYCIVPYVRGREVSRSPEDILSEIVSHLRRGVKEITLLGQNVNSYRFVEGGRTLTFPDLLGLIADRVPELPWLRFLTSHPKDFSDELIGRLAAVPGLCRHVHLPVQHGSNRILASMNRKYTREHYLGLVERIRERVPGATLCTDLIVGFPGETEEDFRAMVDLVRRVRFEDAFTYYFNPIEGTKAYELPDPVPEDVKLERLRELIEVQRSITASVKAKKIGTTVRVLAEAVSKKKDGEILARSEHDDMIVLPGGREHIGTFRTARLLSLKGNTFLAEEVP